MCAAEGRLFHVQRLSGGVPRRLERASLGPKRARCRRQKLKKGTSEDRWALLRRDGHVVIIKVTENAAIKSSGVYLSFDPESVRGDAPLLLALKGYERVHLCRHDSCPEEGQHFKEFRRAQRSGSKAMGWFFSKANTAAKKLKDHAGESEREETEVRCADGKENLDGAA